MHRELENGYAIPSGSEPRAGELPEWVSEREIQAPGASAEDLHSALRVWKRPTKLAATPAFHQLLERWRPVHAPEIPTTLLVAFSKYEASDWLDATHGTRANGYTSPPFYELGVFQVPAGLHGRCTEKTCEHAPPGLEKPGSPSAWSRLCARLRLDPKNWSDPTTQVRVGLANLESDALVIRRRYPELFPQPGSDWDLRAAVLLPFVGIGTANTLIKANRQQLAQLPEGKRWAFLSAQAIRQQPNAGRAARMRQLLDNVEKKMRLHAALVTHFGSQPGGSPASTSPASTSPAPAAPAASSAPSPSPATAASDVAAFAARLGATWSSRRKGSPSGPAIADWLVKDHQATLEGATARFKNRFTRAALNRAWMISREEQMKFKTLQSGQLRSLSGFNPPSQPVLRVSSALIAGSDKEKVAPVVVRFVEELRRRHTASRADTYRGHGGGSFAGKGYSLDLWLSSGLDARGFYAPAAAVTLLRAVGAAAQAVKMEWRVLYNDFSVANVINRESGIERVVFVGTPVKGGIIWHGPQPLILHIHLDLGVQRGA